MADYGMHPRTNPRPTQYGQTSAYQRDAAFSNIFGAAPSGRSQMMGEEAPPPAERASTMSSVQSSSTMLPQQSTSQQSFSARMQQDGGYGQPNGYYAAQRQPNGIMPQQQIPQQQQQQPHFLPRPTNPDRRGFQQQPQRIEARQNALGAQYTRPIPNRGPPGGPPPALRSDQYRSQSLAGTPLSGQGSFPSPSPGYPQQAPANAFRNQQYHPPTARSTAQGRMIPERHDERAMSMTSRPVERDHTQTMSGRVIPSRRRESDQGTVTMDSYSPQGFSAPRPQTEQRSANGASGVSSAPRSFSGPAPNSRTMSMTSTIIPERSDSMVSRSNISAGHGSSGTMTNSSRGPLVYPALLSRVSKEFLARIDARDRDKNGLTYKMSFTGKDAVDLISYIIKTTDRNLALLLGRALDAQKFFHDVTYEHRLRDSTHEIYQFRDDVYETENSGDHVNGVFTLLTECYSPTCTKDKLCYSIACPRRLEQQARNNLRPLPGLSKEPLRDELADDDETEAKLWINSVSKEVSDKISEKERKRQEVVFELMYTERDFVKDLEYLRDFWIKPLSKGPIAHQLVPDIRRDKFVKIVFGNVLEILSVSSRLAEALTKRQQVRPVVDRVGDIFLTYVKFFEPFTRYGANQILGKYEFEMEKSHNPAFAKFVDEVERLKESRKLELNGYLTKPTTRLARYPLLLEQILKNTSEGPDLEDIPEVTRQIKAWLGKVNTESGKAENRFNLAQLSKGLRFEQGAYVDLKLADEGRQMLFKGALKKDPNSSSGDIQVYLFDHAILMAKLKPATKSSREEVKVWKRPIPLELLVILQMEEVIPKQRINRPSSSITSLTGLRPQANQQKSNPQGKETYPITFKHLGKPPYEITLYATTYTGRQKWLQHIGSQQSKLRESKNVYKQTIYCHGYFTYNNRINCAVPIDGGRKLVYGTDSGVYVSEGKPGVSYSQPRKALDISNVTQVDALEEYSLLLVLAQKTLYSYALQALDPDDGSNAIARRPKKIVNHANFFRAGVCVGRHLVCAAKNSSLSTTIKVFEPNDALQRGRQQAGMARLFRGAQDSLKPYKEFYIPTESSSIHFLRAKLCVACAKGFEIVSLDTLETQSLLDQADTSLDFVAQQKDTKPVHIERLNGEFLLNYSEFSFFVNRNGWRARPDWLINWEGSPQSFALFYPYILAFEQSFIEIRHVETSACVHIITAKNIRMLHSSSHEIIYAYEEENGEDVVASLDFWHQNTPGPQTNGARS